MCFTGITTVSHRTNGPFLIDLSKYKREFNKFYFRSKTCESIGMKNVNGQIHSRRPSQTVFLYSIYDQ